MSALTEILRRQHAWATARGIELDPPDHALGLFNQRAPANLMLLWYAEQPAATPFQREIDQFAEAVVLLVSEASPIKRSTAASYSYGNAAKITRTTW